MRKLKTAFAFVVSALVFAFKDVTDDDQKICFIFRSPVRQISKFKTKRSRNVLEVDNNGILRFISVETVQGQSCMSFEN